MFRGRYLWVLLRVVNIQSTTKWNDNAQHPFAYQRHLANSWPGVHDFIDDSRKPSFHIRHAWISTAARCSSSQQQCCLHDTVKLISDWGHRSGLNVENTFDNWRKCVIVNFDWGRGERKLLSNTGNRESSSSERQFCTHDRVSTFLKETLPSIPQSCLSRNLMRFS